MSFQISEYTGPGTVETESSQPKRASWTNELEVMLLEFLLQETAAGKRADNGFRGATWEKAVGVLKVFTAKQIQQKWDNLKKDYTVFTHLKNASEVGWDDKRQMVTCDNKKWEEYVANHRLAQKFRTKGLRNYALLAQLREGENATRDPAITIERRRKREGLLSSTPEPQTESTGNSEPAAQAVEPEHETQEPRQESRQPYIKRARKTEPRQGGNSKLEAMAELAASLKMLAGASQPISIRERAVKKVQENFPGLHILDFITICQFFQDQAKAEIYNALPDIEFAKEWLKMQFQRENYLPKSPVFSNRPSLHPGASPTRIPAEDQPTTVRRPVIIGEDNDEDEGSEDIDGGKEGEEEGEVEEAEETEETQ